MIEVISVRFRGGCKSYFLILRGLSVPEGEQVVVETAQGAEIGTCVRTNHAVEDHAVIQPLRPVRRIAGEEDKRTAEKNRQREKRSHDCVREEDRGPQAGNEAGGRGVQF